MILFSDLLSGHKQSENPQVMALVKGKKLTKCRAK